jgi:hypothetical protein
MFTIQVKILRVLLYCLRAFVRQSQNTAKTTRVWHCLRDDCAGNRLSLSPLRYLLYLRRVTYYVVMSYYILWTFAGFLYE